MLQLDKPKSKASSSTCGGGAPQALVETGENTKEPTSLTRKELQKKKKSKFKDEREEQERLLKLRIQATSEFLNSSAYKKLPNKSPIVIEVKNKGNFNAFETTKFPLSDTDIKKLHPMLRNEKMKE